MSDYNRVIVLGRLTRDPELKQVPSGTAVVDMGLASNEKFKTRAGELVERACFVDVVAWGRQAESCCKYLSKGSRVLVEGRLQLDQWESDDGQRRSKLRVRAERVNFLARPGGGGTTGAAGSEEEEPMPL